MATVQINGSQVTPTSTKNNGGAVIANSSSAQNIESRPFVQESVDVFSSVVVNGVNTTKALEIGIFSYNSTRPVAMKLTQSLAAVLNTFLLSGANDSGSIKSINNLLVETANGNPENGPFTDGTRTTLSLTAFREGKLNTLTGKYDQGYPVVSEDYFLGANNLSGDKAAKVTRLVPGSLVYKLSKKVPVQQNYTEKTG